MPTRLLWRHIGGRADKRAGRGHGFHARDVGDAKIGQYHAAALAAGFDHDVVGFHVAVDDPVFVRRGQGFGQGQGDERGDLGQEPPAAFFQ